MTPDRFIHRWQHSAASERSNYALFLYELCDMLDLPRPDPAGEDTALHDYVIDRRVDFHHGDGSSSVGYIDLYRRGCFVLEAKQGSNAPTVSTLTGKPRKTRTGTARRGTPGWDAAMQRARNQAENYARALPPEHGRAPFLLVVDIGWSIELYAEFSRSGGSYVPFPDPRSHRIRLTDLREERHRETLRAVWLDPLSLDPSRQAARVTRRIARQLARLAQSLERAGHAPETVAGFLMRALFTMFAEDVGLLPKRCFTELLESVLNTPSQCPHLLRELWLAMDHGGFSAAIRAELLRFNGGLFADPTALPLDREQLEGLLAAARADWRMVEPAIFGTLLEQALDPVERHSLGIHYTPRAYVERLVLPTVIEPLRNDWQAVQAAALTLENQGRHRQAVQQVRDFHRSLCDARVLDPACGSGNFLYVTLEHLKRLEGEVLNTLEELGEAQNLLELAGVTVDPHQMLGLEVNPRAARIAEAVLWIGYLQWHYRTRGNVDPPEPVLRDFHNIECRDAVLARDRIDLVTGDDGRPVTRWDGRTFRKHPVTGEDVPDEAARVPLERYVNPRRASWPEADFVVGNPPFIGAKYLRSALGDGYAEAVRGIYQAQVPESADFVMYWWQRAAELARDGQLRRFGLITTNSLRQTFNRRVLQPFLDDQKKPVSLLFAVPDHPWVKGENDAAAVRIAMTVASAGEHEGILATVTREQRGEHEGLDVELATRHGKLFADLSIGANVAGAVALRANEGISSPGVKLHGAGFIVTREQAEQLGLGRIPGLERHIREYRNGRDLTATPRGVMVIDLFGLSAEQVQERYPTVYQWLLERVKPERDQNNRTSYRDNWWIFGEPRSEFRPALASLDRYIATVVTSKHRFFVFLDQSVLPDDALINIALDDAYHLGVLSSRIHICWALATGSTLEDRPRYIKTRCFETFPFPDTTPEQQQRIRDLAERLDAHRKRQQSEHPDLTLTGMYNVLEKLRAEQPLSDKERRIHEQGLVAILRQLHDELDAAVAEAYGWSDLFPSPPRGQAAPSLAPLSPGGRGGGGEGEILERLVDLNTERAAEEQRGLTRPGLIRWLRPEFQNPTVRRADGQQAEQTGIEVEATVTVATRDKLPWPKTLPDQVQALRATLGGQPLTAEQLAARFKGARRERIEELLETLAMLGQVRAGEGGLFTRGVA